MADNRPFWLKIKERYVIENFDDVAAYFTGFDYDPENPNPDYDQTYGCLSEIVENYLDETSADDLSHTTPHPDENLYLRMCGAYLLAGQQQKLQDTDTMARLAARLTSLGYGDGLAEDLLKFQLRCLADTEVRAFRFNWTHLDRYEFAPSMFLNLLLHTEFDSDAAIPSQACENKGTALLEEGKLTLILGNLGSYRDRSEKMQTLFRIGDSTSVVALESDRLKGNSFEQLMENITHIARVQDGVKPTPRRALKELDTKSGESVHVKLREWTFRVVAETVESGYKTLTGNVYVPEAILGIITRDMLSSVITPGTVFKVNLQSDNPKIPFNLREAFLDFYYEYTEKFENRLEAIHLSSYRMSDGSTGERWLTEDGMIVSVRDTPDDDILTAIADGQPVYIHPYESKEDNAGNIIVNGNYLHDYCSPFDSETGYEDFKRQACMNLLYSYLDWSEEDYVERDREKSEETDSSRFIPLVQALHRMAGMTEAADSTDRLKALTAARILAKICGAERDALYLRHETEFLAALADFAAGKDPLQLKLTHPEELDGNQVVLRREEIVQALHRYKPYDTAIYNVRSLEDDTLGDIRQLVGASNILVDKISEQEINRIRRNITEKLGVQDLYSVAEDARVYYGQESATLEFKSSAVYPPLDKKYHRTSGPDSNLQKWNILKCVCAMLNSVAGGELIVGVGDDGYASSLEDDFKQLTKELKISEPNIDKFTLYLKYMIEDAFIDTMNPQITPRELTSSLISYIPEKENEGNDVLRIKIEPYRYGIVRFRHTDELPEGYSDCYIRQSNTSTPSTPMLENALRGKKQKGVTDNTTRKIHALQKAIGEKRVVKLKDYVAPGGKTDLEVEPFRVLFVRRMAVVFDLKEKKLKTVSLQRFSDVEPVSKEIKSTRLKYMQARTDIFGSPDTGEESLNVEMLLGPVAANAIEQELGVPKEMLGVNNDKATARRFTRVLNAPIFDTAPLVKFYLDFAPEVMIRSEKVDAAIRERLDAIAATL